MRLDKIVLVITSLTILISLATITGVAIGWNYPELNPDSPTVIVKEPVNDILINGLDVTLDSVDPATATLTAIKGDSKIFADDLTWTPGHTEVVYITLTNKEEFDVVYSIGVKSTDVATAKNGAGEDVKLSDLLQFGIINGVTDFYENSVDAATDLSGSAYVGSGFSGTDMVEAGETVVVALVVSLPESVGEINGGDIDLGLSICVLAPML